MKLSAPLAFSSYQTGLLVATSLLQSVAVALARSGWKVNYETSFNSADGVNTAFSAHPDVSSLLVVTSNTCPDQIQDKVMVLFQLGRRTQWMEAACIWAEVSASDASVKILLSFIGDALTNVNTRMLRSPAAFDPRDIEILDARLTEHLDRLLAQEPKGGKEDQAVCLGGVADRLRAKGWQVVPSPSGTRAKVSVPGLPSSPGTTPEIELESGPQGPVPFVRLMDYKFLGENVYPALEAWFRGRAQIRDALNELDAGV